MLGKFNELGSKFAAAERQREQDLNTFNLYKNQLASQEQAISEI